MKFYDDLFALTHRTHALVTLFSLLCERGTDDARQLHAASLRDFLGVLHATRQEIDTHMNALTQDTERALSFFDSPYGFPLSYPMLDKLLKDLAPYLDKYPALTMTEALQRNAENTLDLDWPLDEGAPEDPA